MGVTIRLAAPAADALRILEVYRPYIEHTPVTFETEVPAPAAFTQRVAEIAAEFPFLLLEVDGELIGYAYAHRQAERAAFGWNAELSIYLKADWTGRGLGTPLYALLMRLLALQGYVNFYAVITGSNTGSIAMHERMGFERIGLHARTGFKSGQWHDTVWLHKRVSDGAPGEIRSIHALGPGIAAREMENTRKKIEENLKM